MKGSLLSLLLFICAGALAEEARLVPQQLTRGPSQHFFGYIGHCGTIPWNVGERYVLALRVAFQDHMPAPAEAAEVCLLDTQADFAVRSLDQTHAWNPQQGTMFYWNPEQPETQFFFNDRDPITGRVFTVLYDVASEKRIREYKFPDASIGNSGVAQAGKYFYAINYGRLARLRPVTGYPGADDWTKGIPAPGDDGIFRVEIDSGEKRLILSYAQMQAALLRENLVQMSQELFVNHTLNNRVGDRLCFYARADFDAPAGRVNQLFTMRPDGSELQRIHEYLGGHPEWGDGAKLIGAVGEQKVLYNMAERRQLRVIGGPEIFTDPGGDSALSPDGRWLVNGEHGRSQNTYTFLELATGRVLRTEPLEFGPWGKGDLRLDPAPAWNRSSSALLVPGLAPDGTRQLFILRLPAGA